MADTGLLSLMLKVDGGEASAAEITQVTSAIKGVEGESSKLRDRFQEGFQHVALRGFIADAARGIGIGSEMRPVISMLNLATTQLSESFGVLGTSMALATAGLTAIAALGYVVYEHFQKHGEELGKTFKGYMDNVVAIDEYVAAGGRLSAALRAEAQDERDAAAEVLKKITIQNEASLAVAQETLTLALNTEAYAKRSAARNNDTVGLELTAAATKRAQVKVDELTATLEANGHGFATWQEYVKDGTKELKELDKAAEESQKWMDSWADNMAKDSDKIIAAEEKEKAARLKYYQEVETGVTKLKEVTSILRDQELQATSESEAKKKAVIDQYRDQHLNSIKIEYDRLITAAHGNAGEIVKIEAAKNAAVSQLNNTVAAKQKQNYSEIQVVAGQAYDTIANGISNTMARSIVESKNAHDAIIAMQRQVEEQIIASLIRIAIQATITKEAVQAIFIAA